MYDIIIVEDKKVTRDGLVKLINWQSINANIAAAFSGGSEAQEYVKHHHVDLIISDIEMEKGSGIQLLRYIHQNRPYIKVIIISAYERFSYAHDALALGAYAYVLKPVDEIALLAKCKDAVEEISKMRHSDTQKNHILWERASNAASDWVNEKSILGLPDALLQIESDFDVQGASCFMFHFYGEASVSVHRLREIAAEIGQPVLLFAYKESSCGFLSGKLQACKEVFSILLKQWAIGDNVRIGVSCAGQAIAEWKLLLNQAHTAMSKSFWCNNKGSNIVWFENGDAVTGYKTNAQLNFANLAKQLFADDLQSAIKECNQIFKLWAQSNTPVDYAISQCNNALISLKTELAKSAKSALPESADFSKCSNGEELQAALCEEIASLFQLYGSVRSKVVRPVVKLALDYAMHNINQSGLNLKIIADKLNVSYVYLSKAFKEDFSTGFTECINGYRIELAKKCLDDSQMRVYEVCDKIGMEPKNFHQLFKKQVGMTPKEYQAHVVSYEKKEQP